MTIIKRPPSQKPVIDLAGPQGNAYCLMGIAQSAAKQLGMDADAILDEMKASDYDHLVQTFDKHFGHLYDLIRDQQ